MKNHRTKSNFDIIGDIHGHAYALKLLLKKLDYQWIDGSYIHPEGRKVLFVGDYIDRGPQVKETLGIVKAMVDRGNAIALMGNHEYNALCYHYKKEEGGGHLREHSIKNTLQHVSTLEAFKDDQELYNTYINWFLELPLYYETDSFRATHACWDYPSIEYLREKLNDDKLTKELVYQSALETKGDLHNAIEIVLKGKEISLPKEVKFQDKDGNLRSEIRIKWWENPEEKKYNELCLSCDNNTPNLPIDKEQLVKFGKHYQAKDKPVFFGHYWLEKCPKLMTDNVCCLDYSIASKGRLVAYSFGGEKKLDEEKIVFAFDDERENFLTELHGIYYNNAPLINLEKTPIHPSAKLHFKKGYIIVSTGNEDLKYKENIAQYKKLITSIKEKRFTYIPLYGKFKGIKKTVFHYEKSVIICNFDRKGYSKDFDELNQLALEWTNQLNQESYVCCAPDSIPEFVDNKGVVLFRLSDHRDDYNKYFEEYFTKLSKIKKAKKWGAKFLGAHIHPKPQSLSERMPRDYKGEWFLSKSF